MADSIIAYYHGSVTRAFHGKWKRGLLLTSNLENMWSNVSPEPNSGCWLWCGKITNDGYGVVKVNKKEKYAHRHVYVLANGDIPDGLQIDHLCRVRCCINPFHLEAVTSKENTRRGTSLESTIRAKKSKTHCPYGHPYSGDNLRLVVKSDGVVWRRCRMCTNANARKYWHQRPLAAETPKPALLDF